MNCTKTTFFLIALTALPLALAEPLPPIVPIVTPAELDAAIADVAAAERGQGVKMSNSPAPYLQRRVPDQNLTL